MYLNPNLLERLAQHNVAEAQRGARCAWLYSQLRLPRLRAAQIAAASLIWSAFCLLALQ